MTRAERIAFTRALEERLEGRLTRHERLVVDSHLAAPSGLAQHVVDPIEAAVTALREDGAARRAREASHRPGEPLCPRCGRGVRHYLAACPRGPGRVQ